MPTRRNRTSAPACQRKRSNADRTCGQIVSRRFERICVGATGAMCIVVACVGANVAYALISAYGALILTLAIGGIRL